MDFKTFESDVKDNNGPKGIHIRKQTQVQTRVLLLFLDQNLRPTHFL